MPEDRPYIQANRRELDRMRALVDRLNDDDLRVQVNPEWTVAGVLGHVAFWDARARALAERLGRGEPFTPSDDEPEEVDWINDATRPLIHAVPPAELALLSLRIAEETDALVAAASANRLWPHDPSSPLNPTRASHRGEHLDEIERVVPPD